MKTTSWPRFFSITLLLVIFHDGVPPSASAAEYVARQGDTLSQIARRHGCGVEALRQANGLQGDLILAGQRLTLPSVDNRSAGQAEAPARKMERLHQAAAGAAWPVIREWSEAEERDYSEWFRRLASRAWPSVSRMLRSREFNALYTPADEKITFQADCADFPYTIRAYYAFKRGLPFMGNFVSGGRYSLNGNLTDSTFDNLSDAGGVQKFFDKLRMVHSGNFRTRPEATDSFTYPIDLKRDFLHPGAVFYSPDGHVAMVAECRTDGAILLVDAHPDQSITRIAFGPKLSVQSRTRSGGFRAFRPVTVRNGKAVWENKNVNLPGYSTAQYEFRANYYTTVRQKLSREVQDPVAAFENYIREDIHQEAQDRVPAVERGWAVGKDRAVGIPENIYDSAGNWEDLATPSRDLRLRLSMLHLPELVRTAMLTAGDPSVKVSPGTPRDPVRMARTLLALKERLFTQLKIEYTDSRGKKVPLSLKQIEKRLFLLSFNPNHAPELRWGAGDSSTTLALPSRSTAHYQEEQPWRNRLEKTHEPMAVTDADNPVRPPPHDLSGEIRQLIGTTSRPLAASGEAVTR